MYIVKINTLPNHNLNISIVNLTGTSETQCRYAGLSPYEEKNNSYDEISTICSSSEGHRHQNIYSNTSNILLVFYMYLEYVFLNISYLDLLQHVKLLC